MRITEVGPRDGLQNEPTPVPTAVKVAFVRALVAAGVRELEVSSFVRHDKIPQLSDATQVFSGLGPAPKGVVYGALVPNEKGLDRALAAGVGKIAVFTAASETFNRHNVNATVAEAIARFVPVVRRAKAAGLPVRGYVSAAFVCPYEGKIPPEKAVDVCLRLIDLGCDEVDVGDTIGGASPSDVATLLSRLLPRVPPERVVLHFHDTRGRAIPNSEEGLRFGIASFDSSAGGIGGCPYAPGASGNVATEALVRLFDRLGIEHGIDLAKLAAASALISAALGHAPRSPRLQKAGG